MFTNFVSIIGLIQITIFLSRFYNFFNSMRRQQLDILKRYGGWVLVTGASDGIGAEFCR